MYQGANFSSVKALMTRPAKGEHHLLMIGHGLEQRPISASSNQSGKWIIPYLSLAGLILDGCPSLGKVSCAVVRASVEIHAAVDSGDDRKTAVVFLK